MSSSLDMSLDDLIRKSNEYGSRNSNFRGRGRGSVSVLGPDPDRRFTRRDSIRPNPYSTRPVTQAQELIILSANEGSNGEANLYISNLDYGVSGEDIKVLFTEVGELLRYSLHYDISGRSKGTAEVVYACQTDALAAIKRYNNIQLDGKPLKIELVGVNLITPVPVPVAATSDMAKPHGNVRSAGERIGAQEWGYNGVGSPEFAKRQGQGRWHGEKLTAEALDSDLEKYRIESMKIE